MLSDRGSELLTPPIPHAGCTLCEVTGRTMTTGLPSVSPLTRRYPAPTLRGRYREMGLGHADKCSALRQSDRESQLLLLLLLLPNTRLTFGPPPPGGKESLWLLGAPVRKTILQMHTPAGTSRCWSRQTRRGLGVCIWMHLVNSTGNSPSPDSRPRSNQTGQVIQGLR